MTFTAKLEPADKVTFHLRYEELLQRSEKGQYNYELNLQPENQVIGDFKITIQINESLPLRDISVKRFLNQNEIKFQAETMTQEVLIFDEKTAPHQGNLLRVIDNKIVRRWGISIFLNIFFFSVRPGICVKYFLSFPQKNLSPEKTETN